MTNEIKAVKENQNEPIMGSQRFLQFQLGDENYAIPLLEVKEVIPPPETTSLPNVPNHYVGIMNLRGQIISIIDLRKRLKIEPLGEGAEEAVIIVEVGGIGIGVIVDSINKVLNMFEGEVSEVPEVKGQVNAKYIQGIFKDGKSLTVFLDLQSVLNIEEIQEQMSKSA